LYLDLREFPQRLEDYEISKQFNLESDTRSQFLIKPLIPTEAQVSIVLEIYKYTYFYGIMINIRKL